MEEEMKCDNCEACAGGCTMHEGKAAMACDMCEMCKDGCTMHEGK